MESFSTRGISGYSPQPGWAEQDPMTWRKVVIKTIRETLRKWKAEGKEIIGMTISLQREVVIWGGSFLYNAIIWLDNRILSQVEQIKKTLDPEDSIDNWFEYKSSIFSF
ncbi:MAG: FGGY family carbohydrate kinase [Crenarchaeota archaeon]|nr:FGGY family carbohydrate kinase [Thermoproteota archaeon]